MDIADALKHLEQNRAGVLTTLRADGSPHATVVGVAVVEGRLWISSTQDRVKTKNVRGDSRVVFTAGIRPWAAIEGRATIQDGDDVLERLRLYYRTAAGDHPDWNEYDDAMIRERRLIIDVEPGRAYGSS